MNREEVNSEIEKILSQLSDQSLQVVLSYLKNVQDIDHSELTLSKNIGKILKDDSNLLKRLAQ